MVLVGLLLAVRARRLAIGRSFERAQAVITHGFVSSLRRFSPIQAAKTMNWAASKLVLSLLSRPKARHRTIDARRSSPGVNCKELVLRKDLNC